MKNLNQAIDALPSRLPDASLRIVARRPGDRLRIGAKQVPVADALSWRHFAYGETASPDVVGAIVRHDRHLFNVGLEVPFAVRDARGGDAEKLRSLNEIVGRFGGVMEALMRQLVAPEALAAVPGGPVTEPERQSRRLASFAKLWSEVKYNFVFLSQRPELNWDGLLEKYMARIAATRRSSARVCTSRPSGLAAAPKNGTSIRATGSSRAAKGRISARLWC